MATTYDMTSKATIGVNSNSIAAYTSKYRAMPMRVVEATLDIDKLVADGYTCANGDIFQLLEIPADTYVFAVGAEVLKAFNGTSPTVDIDFAAGDDMIDGGDVSATGWLAAGSNGQGLTHDTNGAALTFTPLVTTTDTIDVKLIAASADVTTGRLRVVAILIDLEESGRVEPDEVARDQLA